MLSTSSTVRNEKRNKCMVPTCDNVYYRPVQQGLNKHFFRIPDKKRQQWINILGIVSTHRELRVCEDHFTYDDFTSTLRNRLHKYAMPSVPDQVVSNIVEVVTSEQSIPNEFSKNSDEESLQIDQTSEKIPYTIDVNGTATSPSKNKSFAELSKENNLQRKTISEESNKKVSCENKVYVYKLPSGRKVMYYHLPILDNLNKGLN